MEAVPRNAAAMDEYGPIGTLLFKTTDEGKDALERFQRALRAGEQVRITTGVGLRIDRLPPLMQPHVTDEPLDDVEITLCPTTPPPTRHWRIVTRSDAGEAEVAADFTPVLPPANWDGALQGKGGGLTVTLVFRRTPGGGEATLNFSFSHEPTLPVVDQLAAAATVVALQGRGSLELRAIDGSLPRPLTFDFDRRGQLLPPFFVVLHRLLTDLRLIEEWTGATLTLPPTISREALRTVAEVAYIIRNRKSEMTFDAVTFELDEAKYESLVGGLHGALRFELPFAVRLFGTEMLLGELVGELLASDVRVVDQGPVQGAEPPTWLVRLEPATEAARHPIFRFERERFVSA